MRPLKPAFVVLVGVLATTAASFGAASPAQAQSLQKLYNNTARGIAKTMRDAQSVIDGANTKQRKSRNKRADNRRTARQIIPPLPERKPRPWAENENGDTSRKASSRRPIAAAPTKKATLKRKNAVPAKRNATKRSKVKLPDKEAASTEGKVAKETAPDIYTDVEINIAKARCKLLLKKVDAVTISQDPVKKGPCGNAAPVKLVSLGTKPKVTISPPALLNCNMVVTLHDWLEKDLQPLAKKFLGAPIIRINNISSYSCRNAYGRKNTRLSEHARANALDIAGFVTAKAKTADLLKHWGPTQRDIKAQRLAEQKAREEEERKAKKEAQRILKAAKENAKKQKNTSLVSVKGDKTAVLLKKPLHDGLPAKVPRGKANKASGEKNKDLKAAPAKLGGAKPRPVASARPTKQKTAARHTSKPKPPSGTSLFLRAAHKRACRRFGTTLGPEANEAHRNHFHVDLAPRKRRNYCE